MQGFIGSGDWDAGVLMVTNAVVPDQLGGQQRYVRELAAALAGLGLVVTVFVRRVAPDLPSEEIGHDGVRLVRFDTPPRTHPLYAAGYPLASFRSVARAVHRHRGVVHVHYPVQGAAPALTRRTYVHTFHAPVHKELLPEHQGRYKLPTVARTGAVRAVRACETVVARRAARTIVLTKYMKRELELLAPEAASRAEIIPGGIDSERFSPGPGLDHPFSREGEPLLFTARRLVPRTGVAELVRAMPYVLADLPRARLAIAGDGPLRSEISALITDLRLERRVRVLGRIPEDELLGWYRSASLFVLPTQELEGFGISTMEALACGTPALGTPIGATPEMLSPIDSRLLSKSGSHRDIADAVVKLCRSPGVLPALADRVRDHVVPKLTWAAVAGRHLEVYDRAARASSGVRRSR
jgi:glycosyltransferase involved in cell wall biosynthesis